jgi:hypothetical protein
VGQVGVGVEEMEEESGIVMTRSGMRDGGGGVRLDG